MTTLDIITRFADKHKINQDRQIQILCFILDKLNCTDDIKTILDKASNRIMAKLDIEINEEYKKVNEVIEQTNRINEPLNRLGRGDTEQDRWDRSTD